MDGSKIKIDSKELAIIDKENKDVENLNNNILIMRKKQLYLQVAESSKQRLKLLKRITKWIDLLEEKIFSDDAINEMDVDKAISLFKYISNLNLKTLMQTDRLEEILGKYLESGAFELQRDLNNGKLNVKEDLGDMKKEIMTIISNSLKSNTTDAEIVNRKAESIVDEIEIDDLEELPKVDIDEE